MAASSPTIELFSIGTELVYGQIQDTNSYWMAQQVIKLGAKVRRVTQLTDDLDDIVSAFRSSVERGTNLVVSSGGLGPTPDDLTTTALSQLTGSPLIVHEDVIADYMTRRNIPTREEMNPNLVRMATVPARARVMVNPVGWAPCVCVTEGDTTFLAIAGPPREMEAVFVRHVIPFISEHYETKAATQRILVNTHESEIAPNFQEIMAQYPGCYIKGYIAMTAQPGWLPVDILATGENAEEAQLTVNLIIEQLRKILADKGKTLTVYAESVTAEQ